MQIDDLNGALNFCNGLNINLGTISNIITATTRSDTLNALVVSLCSEARAGQTTLTLISCLPSKFYRRFRTTFVYYAQLRLQMVHSRP